MAGGHDGLIDRVYKPSIRLLDAKLTMTSTRGRPFIPMFPAQPHCLRCLLPIVERYVTPISKPEFETLCQQLDDCDLLLEQSTIGAGVRCAQTGLRCRFRKFSVRIMALMKPSVKILAILMVAAVPLLAQEAESVPEADYDALRLTKIVYAVRIDQAITVDGILDEAVWELAEPATDFLQVLPDTGFPATMRTEARFLYDDENLYAGYYCFDSNMEGLAINDMREDFGFNQNDSVSLIIDSLHDRRSAFMFSTNPAGGRRDAQVSNDGETNQDWDGVWDVQVVRGDGVWTVEFVVPFKTLRFSVSSSQEWGLNITRRVTSLSEESTWSPIPRRFRGSRVSLAGTLTGLEGIRQGQNLRVKPFATAGFTTTPSSGGSSTETDQDYDGGVDLKYSLTPSVTLDATYRTDFAQVEVDTQQVNLTRFNLFFPEKREFFLENSGTFTFGGGNRSNLVPFFSRRIGLSRAGTPIPIVGGARVTGQVGGWDVGILDMKTESQDATPSNNYLVGRVKRNLLTNSWVGALVTNRDSTLEGDYNRVYGADAHFLFYGNRLGFDSFILRSDTPGTTGRNQARQFEASWRDTELVIAAGYNEVQTNFNPEVGFVRRTDNTHYNGEFAFNPLIESSAAIRNLTFGTNWDYYKNGTTEQVETREQRFNFGVQLRDGGSITFNINETFDRLTEPFNIRPDIQIAKGDYKYQRYSAVVSTDPSDRVSSNATYEWGKFWNGDRKSFRGGVDVKASPNLRVGLDYNHNRVDLPNGKFTTDLLVTRFDYAFSPYAFLNAFVQYNADRHQVSSNIRFNFTYRPLSDIFIVYNNIRDTDRGRLVQRALIVKVTNLISF